MENNDVQIFWEKADEMQSHVTRQNKREKWDELQNEHYDLIPFLSVFTGVVLPRVLIAEFFMVCFPKEC